MWGPVEGQPRLQRDPNPCFACIRSGVQHVARSTDDSAKSATNKASLLFGGSPADKRKGGGGGGASLPTGSSPALASPVTNKSSGGGGRYRRGSGSRRDAKERIVQLLALRAREQRAWNWCCWSACVNGTSCSTTQTRFRPPQQQGQSVDAASQTLFWGELQLLRTLQKKHADVFFSSIRNAEIKDLEWRFDGRRCSANILIMAESNSISHRSHKSWSTVLGTRSMAPNSGVYEWVVEIEVCEKGHVFLGIATEQANLDSYVGCDRHGVSGYRRQRRHRRIPSARPADPPCRSPAHRPRC